MLETEGRSWRVLKERIHANLSVVCYLKKSISVSVKTVSPQLIFIFREVSVINYEAAALNQM